MFDNPCGVVVGEWFSLSFNSKVLSHWRACNQICRCAYVLDVLPVRQFCLRLRSESPSSDHIITGTIYLQPAIIVANNLITYTKTFLRSNSRPSYLSFNLAMDDLDIEAYRPTDNDGNLIKFYNLIWRMVPLFRQDEATEAQVAGFTVLIKSDSILLETSTLHIPELRAAVVR